MGVAYVMFREAGHAFLKMCLLRMSLRAAEEHLPTAAQIFETSKRIRKPNCPNRPITSVALSLSFPKYI